VNQKQYKAGRPVSFKTDAVCRNTTVSGSVGGDSLARLLLTPFRLQYSPPRDVGLNFSHACFTQLFAYL
jgi:hypothetical protein